MLTHKKESFEALPLPSGILIWVTILSIKVLLRKQLKNLRESFPYSQTMIQLNKSAGTFVLKRPTRVYLSKVN